MYENKILLHRGVTKVSSSQIFSRILHQGSSQQRWRDSACLATHDFEHVEHHLIMLIDLSWFTVL